MFHVGLFRPFLSPALASPLSSPGMSLPHSSTCLWCLYLLQALVFSIKYKTHLLTTPHLCPKVIFPGWKFLGHKQIHWASVSYDITYAELTFRKISFKSLFRKKKVCLLSPYSYFCISFYRFAFILFILCYVPIFTCPSSVYIFLCGWRIPIFVLSLFFSHCTVLSHIFKRDINLDLQLPAML